MYGSSDDYAYMNAQINGLKKSVKILYTALKKISVEGSDADRLIALEAIVDNQDQEKKTKIDAEKA